MFFKSLVISLIHSPSKTKMRYTVFHSALLCPKMSKVTLMADDIGKKAHREFVRKRLVEKKKTTFHSPVKKQNLKTFATQAKSSMVCGKERRNINNSREKRLWATGDTGARASS